MFLCLLNMHFSIVSTSHPASQSHWVLSPLLCRSNWWLIAFVDVHWFYHIILFRTFFLSAVPVPVVSVVSCCLIYLSLTVFLVHFHTSLGYRWDPSPFVLLSFSLHVQVFCLTFAHNYHSRSVTSNIWAASLFHFASFKDLHIALLLCRPHCSAAFYSYD